jgi:hypothetical protein
VWAATGFWLLFALVSFLAAGDSLAADNRDPEADLIATRLGPEAVGGAPAVAASGVIAIVVGVVTLGLALLLLSRRGWSRFALVGVGAFGAISLAWDARWEVFPAFGLLFLGSVALMLPASHRFLRAG